jgi:hypothetical protein
MIVSADKDFKQLQRYGNVRQYSNLLKKFLVEPNAIQYIFEHICKGDSSDGVPNIFSDDDTFIIDGKRQRPISKKKIAALWESSGSGDVAFEKEIHKRNFQRNQKMIDLEFIPDDVRAHILREIEAKDKRGDAVNKMKFMNYLIQKRCNLMLERLPEFF